MLTDGRTDGLTDGRTDGRKIGRLYRTLLQAGAIKMMSLLCMREPTFRGVKPGETNKPFQFQKTIRGMKSVHHNSRFLIFDFKMF